MEEHLQQFLSPEAPEAQERVERLKTCFSRIDCFGLTHPGLKVTKPAYEGKIADIDPDFFHLLDSFTEVFFSDNFPSPSCPLGTELTTTAFTQTVRNFCEAFANSRGMALGLREAFVKVQMLQEREQLIKAYRAWLETEFPDHAVIEPETLKKDMATQQAEFQKKMLSMLKPFHLKPEE